MSDEPKVFAQYGGSESCRDCHAEEYRLWKNSNHALAERPVQAARDRGAFAPTQTFRHGTQSSTASWSNGIATVTAIGLSGRPEPHAIARVIGNDPLLQYLVPFPGGRFQTLEASYDPHSNQWFNAYGNEDRQPGEWGHWTGRGMNWNSMCAECHNTRLRKNYNTADDTFHTTMAEVSVGCEACHGPLRAHNEWQNKHGKSGGPDPTLKKLTRQQTVDNCGFCHSLRTGLTGDFKPGDNFSDDCELLMVDASERYYADGQIRGEDYEYASFLSSRMHLRGVYCLDCHNPHSYKTILPGNWLCLRCHATGSKVAPGINPVTHSRHKVHGFDTNGVAVNVDLAAYNSKTVPETGGECVNCHMPQTPYMQRHWRHDHGFTSPDPLLTKQSGIPNACNRCHQDQDADWALKFCNDWYGPKMERPARRRAQIIAQAQRGDPAAADGLLSLLKKEDVPYWRAVESDLLLPWATQPEVVSVLLAGLQNTNALVRAASARALEPALAAGAGGALQARLNDPARNVRIAAAWSLRGTLDAHSPAGVELQQYLDLNADEPVGQLNEGNYDYAKGDLPSAAQHFQKAVDWDARSVPFHQSLAVALSALNRPQAAVETLEQAVRFSPEDAESRYQLGLAYNGVGDLTNTLTQLSAAVRLDPGHVAAWYNLGLAQNASGKTEAALASLARAESLAPADARISYAQATIFVRRGRTDEAIRELKRTLEIDPAHADARRLLQILFRPTTPKNQTSPSP
ncbi:MAG: tetratricopeptide repeat protein [Verrucomicrobiae bacterium]|nr:tetratricopeptide repeat protein [Verrucomicrobiae bacterium]